MKKILLTYLSAGLCLIIIMAFFACGNKNSSGTTDTTDSESSSEPAVSGSNESTSEESTAEATEALDNGLYKKLVVLGDSISTGYGLSGYKKGTGNNGVASFANKVASENKLKYGTDYFNLAVDGYKSYDVLQGIDSGAVKVMGADLVLISVGGNDVMYPMVEGLADISGISLSNVSDGVQFVFGFMNAGEDEIAAFKTNFATKGEEFDTMLTGLINNYANNLDKIIDAIRELAPDAKIVIQTVYNPIDDENIIKSESMKFLNDNVVGKYIGMLNEVIRSRSQSLGYTVVDTAAIFAGKGVIYTNISNNDIHPNAVGHRIIAEKIISETKKNSD